MKKKHPFAKILSFCFLSLMLTGCTTLSYIDDDVDATKISHIQTNENFTLQIVEKTTDEGVVVEAGISQTLLESALVLYMNIKNNTDSIFKFDINDIEVTSPIGDVTFITPSNYIEGYQNFEAMNYTGMMTAGSYMGGFSNLQNQYRQTIANPAVSNVEEKNKNSGLAVIEETIKGIQKHTLTSFKFIRPNSEEYYYIFLNKPDEYPLTVKYKDLEYKFGGKRNESK